MQFTSRTAESYDPQPWARMVPYATVLSERSAEPGPGRVHDPRPEFEPTRDERPWYAGTGTGEEPEQRFDYEQGLDLLFNDMALAWAPRDRNRNRILISLRTSLRVGSNPETAIRAHLHMTDPITDEHSTHGDLTVAEIEHARNVLTLLVAVSE